MNNRQLDITLTMTGDGRSLGGGHVAQCCGYEYSGETPTEALKALARDICGVVLDDHTIGLKIRAESARD